jgi:hypothetical protein
MRVPSIEGAGLVVIVDAISETGEVPPEIAKLQGIVLAGVFGIIISGAGRRAREGQSQGRDRQRAGPSD